MLCGSEAVVKTLNHIFMTMIEKPLTWFIPEWAEEGRQELKGSKMFGIKLPPVDESPLLRTVPRIALSIARCIWGSLI